MTVRSWMLEENPMVMGCESPRMTAPYQTEDSSQFVTFPMTDAEGAMNVSLVLKGLDPQNVITGRWRVKISAPDLSLRKAPVSRRPRPTMAFSLSAMAFG